MANWNHPLADHLDAAAERSLPSRQQRAQRGTERVHAAGAAALTQGLGVRADIKDPSFGDNARVIDAPHPSAPGYRLRIGGPHPDAHGPMGEGTNSWHMRIDPPGVDHTVGGEEVHHEELGAFHPRELPGRVAAVLGRPDVQAKVAGDQSNVVGQLERHSRNTARGQFLTAHDVDGPQGVVDHFSHLQRAQFGGN